MDAEKTPVGRRMLLKLAGAEPGHEGRERHTPVGHQNGDADDPAQDTFNREQAVLLKSNQRRCDHGDAHHQRQQHPAQIDEGQGRRLYQELWDMLLEHRLDEGPYSEEEALGLLREWAAAEGIEVVGE